MAAQINSFNSSMMAQAAVEADNSRSFSVENGVKQGCVLAPTLFSIYLSAMLNEAIRDCNKGVLMSQLWQLPNSMTFRRLCICSISRPVKSFGLQINLKKPEVMVQDTPEDQRDTLQ